MTDVQIIDRIAEGLAHSEYSLLLGSGASVGAFGGNGRALPTCTGLAQALVKDFEIDTGGEILSLMQIYSSLQRNQGNRVNAYLHEWFTGCRPSWQHLLAEFNWKRIWTLNIDDVVEVGFNREGRPADSLTWNERFSDNKGESGQQIIHLHGLANRLVDEGENENALVFSLSDYARAVANPKSWHKVFLDEFAGNPFLIIGAQLTEEIDLWESLERGSVAHTSTGLPSVVVVPSITPFRRDQLEASGFTVVETEGETFVRELLDRYREVISDLGDLYGPGTPGIKRFLQQFIDLRSFEPHGINSEDFYSGYQPTWDTIMDENDAILDKTNQASTEVINLATSDQIYQKIVFLAGNLGTGKSTGLLRIASNLKGVGAHPFLFRADEYMDVESTIEWLKTVPRTVLLFDDFADHSSTLQQLAERCRKEGVRMLLVCSDRSVRRPIITDRIDQQYLNPSESFWYGSLSDDDIDRVIKKLHSRGRLGHITRWGKRRQRNHFVESANRSLFDAMAELEGGPGFRETVRQVYQTLPTDGLRKLYAASCLCYAQSIPMPTGIGADFAGVDPKDLANLIENQCSGLLILTRIGIRPPHRITASLAINTLSRVARAEISLALAKALAPHVDERAMRAGTREYRIVRYLMNHEYVSQQAGEVEGRNWYDSLRDYYDWNGRYWDQRALFESKFEQHETAQSYAERSIKVHPHSFGHNTLGTVLLRMAIRQGSVDALRAGISSLETAKAFRDWGAREHPYTTYFTSMIRYGQVWGIVQVPHQERNAWNEWFREAQSSQVFSTHKGQEELSRWHREWLQFAVDA